MKTTASLLLIGAALLPSPGFAGTEPISATRGHHCNIATSVTVSNAAGKADPMEQEINALVNSTTDPVLASYYRDLYRAPASSSTVTFVRTPDPYVDAISLALFGTVEPDSRLVC